jgi:hypothetical protein
VSALQHSAVLVWPLPLSPRLSDDVAAIGAGSAHRQSAGRCLIARKENAAPEFLAGLGGAGGMPSHRGAAVTVASVPCKDPGRKPDRATKVPFREPITVT